MKTELKPTYNCHKCTEEQRKNVISLTEENKELKELYDMADELRMRGVSVICDQNKEIKELKGKLEKAEKALKDFREKKRVEDKKERDSKNDADFIDQYDNSHCTDENGNWR